MTAFVAWFHLGACTGAGGGGVGGIGGGGSGGGGIAGGDLAAPNGAAPSSNGNTDASNNANLDDPSAVNPPPPSSHTLSAAVPLATGVNGPGADPVNCRLRMLKKLAQDVCYLPTDNKKIRIHWKGYVQDLDKDKPPVRASKPSDCPIFNSGNTLPGQTASEPETVKKDPCCQGQFVRVVDEASHRFVEGQINDQFEFDVNLITKRDPELKVSLAPEGYVSADPNDTKICGGFGTPCDPDSYATLGFDFKGPFASFPENNDIPPCPIDLINSNSIQKIEKVK